MKLHTQNTHVDVDILTTIYFCTIHSSISIHLHIFFNPRYRRIHQKQNHPRAVATLVSRTHWSSSNSSSSTTSSPPHLLLHHLCLFLHCSLLFVITGWFFVFFLLLGVLFCLCLVHRKYSVDGVPCSSDQPLDGCRIPFECSKCPLQLSVLSLDCTLSTVVRRSNHKDDPIKSIFTRHQIKSNKSHYTDETTFRSTVGALWRKYHHRPNVSRNV